MSMGDSRFANCGTGAVRLRRSVLLLVMFIATLAPLTANAESRWGVELSSQPSMFLPGVELGAVYERGLSADFVLSASSGFSASYAASLLHDQWELASISTLGFRWSPIMTGIEAVLILRLLELSDGAPLPGSSFTSMATGPAVVSRLPIVRGRRLTIALEPRAGLLWTATRRVFSSVPDWYLGLGLTALF